MPKRAIAVTTALFAASGVVPAKVKMKPKLQPPRRVVPDLDEALDGLVMPPRPLPVTAPSLPVPEVAPQPATPQAATPTPASASTAPARSGRTHQVLARIRECESGSDYSARSASGRYGGAYQMDRRTFASVGGSGDPATASKAEQDYRARLLYQQRGSQPWPNCSRRT